MAMKDTIVFYPYPGMGHLVPMVELAKLFLPHNLEVSIVLMDTPYKLAPVADFIARISATYPSISFHQLPPHSAVIDHPDRTVVMFEQMHHNNPNLQNFMSSHSKSCKVRALVLDFFCTDALEVANEFQFPSYFFFTSGAYALASFIYVPTMLETIHKNLEEMGDELVEFPGCPPIPASHLPRELMNRDSDCCKTLAYHFNRLSKADGIFINTFDSLEERAVRALRDGLCTPGRHTPPVYCIGPLIVDGDTKKEEKHDCIEWLDSQPKNSVVFLCFGSMGAFKAEQLTEIAKGLEASGQRFIWVVRAPVKEGKMKSIEDLMVEPELETFLPAGFLERTKDRGMVVKKWAPQTAVLGHEAVGGFVTHCGWNSILESILNGVPMIAWPMYAEQKMNKVFLVEEMKLAVAMQGYNEELVVAEEVETKVKWLMTSEGGIELRERTEAAMIAAAKAKAPGGSSKKAFLQVVENFMC